MIHILDVSCRSVAYPERYRDTVFTTIVYPELYRDTVFAMIVFLDMYHDTASIVVSFRVPASCVSAVARALPCVCVVIRTHVSLPMFHLEVHCRKCPMQKRATWKASRVTSGTAYSCEVRGSGGVDQVGNLDLSVCWCRPGLERGPLSCCQPGWEPGALVVSTRWNLAMVLN